jgi:hypothetical protein
VQGFPLRALKGAEAKSRKFEENGKLKLHKKSEIPEVGWVAEPEIHAKMRNSIQKSEIHPKKQLAGARAKTMKNLLRKKILDAK